MFFFNHDHGLHDCLEVAVNLSMTIIFSLKHKVVRFSSRPLNKQLTPGGTTTTKAKEYWHYSLPSPSLNPSPKIPISKSITFIPPRAKHEWWKSHHLRNSTENSIWLVQDLKSIFAQWWVWNGETCQKMLTSQSHEKNVLWNIFLIKLKGK